MRSQRKISREATRGSIRHFGADVSTNMQENSSRFKLKLTYGKSLERMTSAEYVLHVVFHFCKEKVRCFKRAFHKAI
jgi:hypothetical protein